MPSEATRPSGLAERIAPHLPHLRRYARALTGSQGAGDRYVATLLEALIADRGVIDPALTPKIGLYRAFQRLWASAGGSEAVADQAVEDDEEIVRERLGRLAPQSRQALLLTAVEGFSAEDAGAVMELGAAEIDALVALAVQELRRQTRARVLVIEDEPIIAMDIEQMVVDMGHDVIGIADTRDTAVDAAMKQRPDLVLADIQLADGSSGIDAVRDILASFSVPVIFITAYPDRLLTGARPEPTFLIAKPFRAGTVQAAVSQALFFRQSATV
nr:response regulator [Rubrimonas cliftonensis]